MFRDIMKELMFAVEDYPVGYPRQAAFADSDESFMIFRRFGYIHARLLMRRQDEIRELQEELEDMDKRDNEIEDRRICLQSRDVDELRGGVGLVGGQTRSAILDKLEVKVLKYGTSLPHRLVANAGLLWCPG